MPKNRQSEINTNSSAAFEHAGKTFEQANQAFLGFEFKKALSLYQQALSLYQKLKDKKSQLNIGMCLGNIGLVHYQLGNYETAKKYHLQALEISQRLQDKRSQADDWGNLGLVAYKQSDFPYAIECLEKALKLYTELEYSVGVGRQLGNLGIVYFLMGQYDLARKHFLDAIPFVEPNEKSDFYSHLGTIQMSLSDYQGAEEYFTYAIKLAQEFGDFESEACGLGNLGLTYQGLEKYEKAKNYHEEALAIDQRILNKEAEGIDWGHLGLVYQELGDFNQAAKCHLKAVNIARSIGNRFLEVSQLFNLGLLYYEFGIEKDSEEHINQALSLAYEALEKSNDIEHQDLIILGNFLIGATMEYFDNDNTNLAAYISYQRAINALDKIRTALVWEQSRIGFMKDKVNLYERIVCVAIKLGKTKEAYGFAEKGKSRAFLEMLNKSYPEFVHRVDIKPIQDKFLQQEEADIKINSVTDSNDSETDYIEKFNKIWEQKIEFSPTESLSFEEIQQCLN